MNRKLKSARNRLAFEAIFTLAVFGLLVYAMIVAPNHKDAGFAIAVMALGLGLIISAGKLSDAYDDYLDARDREIRAAMRRHPAGSAR